MKPREWPFKIWPYLDIWNEDYQLIKRHYSALIQGSSDLELILLDNEIENVVICGIAKDICCDLTARDAMMLNFCTLMVSDGCAISPDEEHGTTLIAFYTSFGDVQNTDELCSRLEAFNRKNVASWARNID